MRAPDDLPRRPRRAGRGRRGRTTLIVAVIAVFVLLTSLRGIARFYTDFLWYDSLDQSGVWRGVLGAKVVLAVLFIALFFVLAWANLFIADRIAPPFRAGRARGRAARALPRPRRPSGRAGCASSSRACWR